MRRSWCCCFASLILAAGATGAATMTERTVHVGIAADGTYAEQVHLRVRLDTAADVEEWETYPIYLDDHRELVRVEAWAVDPAGGRVKVKRRDRDTAQVSSGYVLHGSERYELLVFSGLRAGSQVEIDYEVAVRPYFPAGTVSLRADDEIERLRVTVEGGGELWRWHLDGPSEGLVVEERSGGVVVTGESLPEIDPPDYAPSGARVWPVLRYAWGPAADWESIGRWYRGLLASVERAPAAVRAQARELTGGLEEPRARLEALLAFARRQVRYVAVEVGEGGFRPSPPGEVLERRWGDCKDKSLLLVDLLAAAGIPAHPTLVLSSRRSRIDAGFPSPWHFNHMIVAVEAAAVAPAEGDPSAGGFLFVDPTQTRGAARWLQSGVQDQDALVVSSDGGRLVHLPMRPELEVRTLVVDLAVDLDGNARGSAGIRLEGESATGLLDQLDSAPPERTEEDVRRIFRGLLPGMELESIGWQPDDGEIPKMELGIGVRLDGLVQGLDSPLPSLQLPGLGAFPEARILDDREVPVVLSPREAVTTWRLRLPEGWCPPRAQVAEVDNEVGFFHQTTAVDPSASMVVVERRVGIRRRWIEPDAFPALKELALAESRAHRRRIRLECDAPSP